MASIQAARASAGVYNRTQTKITKLTAQLADLTADAADQLTEVQDLLPEGATITYPGHDDTDRSIKVCDAPVRSTELLKMVREHIGKQETDGWAALADYTDEQLQEVIGNATTDRGAFWKARQVAERLQGELEAAVKQDVAAA